MDNPHRINYPAPEPVYVEGAPLLHQATMDHGLYPDTYVYHLDAIHGADFYAARERGSISVTVTTADCEDEMYLTARPEFEYLEGTLKLDVTLHRARYPMGNREWSNLLTAIEELWPTWVAAQQKRQCGVLHPGRAG